MPIAQHVKYPLVPVRFALTRHASCMLHATDQVGYPHHHASLARLGVPHIHTPHTTAPALGGHEGETPQPSSPHRLAGRPPRSPIASALKGARGNGSRPPMHARRCSTHARFVRGRGRRYGSVAGRSCPTLLELLARPHSSLRPSRYVPAVTSQPVRESIQCEHPCHGGGQECKLISACMLTSVRPTCTHSCA